jgi:predicted acyl esterase
LPRFGSRGSTTGSRASITGCWTAPRVRAFLMGANRWLDFDAWPPEEVTSKQLDLHAGTGWSDASLNGGAATFERLCDEYPDGRSMSVCDGILRARYRDSTQRPELMDPGKIYEFEVDLWATAQSFPLGHRLRVELTSSDFPRYERNLNTGGPLGRKSLAGWR